MSPAVTAEELDALWRGRDERYLERLRACTSPPVLQRQAERLLGDGCGAHPNPWARQVLLSYLDAGVDEPHHRTLVKRLFKGVEQVGDDQVLARMAAAFDRLGGYTLLTGGPTPRWKAVAALGRRGVARIDRRARDAATGALRPGRKARLDRFSVATRGYLRRRAWRRLNALARTDPARYRAAAVQLLLALPQAHLGSAPGLLSSTVALRVMFAGGRQLDFTPKGAVLKFPHGLASVVPAPARPAAWASGAEDLFHLVRKAPATVVRWWAAQVLCTTHAPWLSQVPVDDLAGLVGSPHPEVRALGLAAVRARLGDGPLDGLAWKSLLLAAQAEAAAQLCALAFGPTPALLEPADLVELCTSGEDTVASAAWAALQERALLDGKDTQAMRALVSAPSQSVRRAAADWLKALPPGQLPPACLAAMIAAEDDVVRWSGLSCIRTRPELARDGRVLQALARSTHLPVLQLVVRLPATALLPVVELAALTRRLLEQHPERTDLGAIMVRRLAALVRLRGDQGGAALAALRSAVRHGRPRVRNAALSALAQVAERSDGAALLARCQVQVIPPASG